MRIGFLGLGAMGSRMARRLLAAGHQVTVYNRSRGAADPLLAEGATWAAAPCDAARGAEVVISMVRDDVASQAVWLGPRGALSGLDDGAIGLEMSTLSVAAVQGLGAASGGRVVDAPVVGTTPHAEAGGLVVLLGADAAVADRLAPVLAPLSKAVHPLCGLGRGMVVKLAVNSLFGAQLAAVAQLIGFVEKAGVDPAAAVSIIAGLPIASPMVAALAPKMLGDAFPAMFPIELVAKDFACIAQTAAAVGADINALDAAGQIYRDAVEAGRGGDNIHGVVRGFR